MKQDKELFNISDLCDDLMRIIFKFLNQLCSRKEISNHRHNQRKYHQANYNFLPREEIEKIEIPNHFLSDNSKLNVFLVGNRYVGKTSMILKCLGSKMEEFPIIAENYKDLDMGNGNVVRLWDSAGEYDRMRQLSYRNMDLILICYAVHNLYSFECVKTKFIQEAKAKAPNTPCILVAMKIDLRNDKETQEELELMNDSFVSYEDGLNLAKELKCITFFETACPPRKESYGFDNIGEFLLKLYYYSQMEMDRIEKEEETIKPKKKCFLQ